MQSLTQKYTPLSLCDNSRLSLQNKCQTSAARKLSRVLSFSEVHLANEVSNYLEHDEFVYMIEEINIRRRLFQNHRSNNVLTTSGNIIRV